MNGVYLIVSIIILIIIVVSLTTSISFSPYAVGAMYNDYYPYEGFSSISHDDTNNTVVNTKVPNMYNNQKKAPSKKVFGFDGLYNDPQASGTKLDYFSDAKGDLACQGSGLTNSQGSLCLDATMTRLLSTRGGNAKGGESKIGA